jgi:hypothetical protein
MYFFTSSNNINYAKKLTKSVKRAQIEKHFTVPDEEDSGTLMWSVFIVITCVGRKGKKGAMGIG